MNHVAVEPAGPDGWERVRRIDELAFGYTWSDAGKIHQELLELDRTVIASVNGVDAGIASTYSLQMSVPGTPRQPVAGLTWVGVLPTHRRQGVLTAMMRQHLDDLQERAAEPIAALYASEPSIYGRFGYGHASSRVRVIIPREFSRLALPQDPHEPTVSFVDPDDVRPQVAVVADQVAVGRAGIIARGPRWWDRTFDDHPENRNGFSELRALLVADPEGPRGYALFRTKESWGQGGANGELDVREVMASDPLAHRAVWRTLLGTDLMGQFTYWALPTDDPLLHLLTDPRRAQPTLSDALFVRIVDVARALTARTYAVEVDLVMDLEDDFCGWNTGRWRLSGGPAGATCAPTTESADLSLDARSLGAVYLGGTSVRGLADAGFVTEHRPGSVDGLSRAFLAARAPWCPLVF